MKSKILTIFLNLFILAASAQVGNIIYKQDFENYQDGDMIMVDNDHLTPHISGYQTWIVKDGVASSSSWYDDGNKTADDWMITPVIHLGNNSALLWKAMTPDKDYRDGYQVLITTDVNNPTNLSSYTKLLDIPAENTSWTMRDLDLSQYANQDVRLAWRNNSTDKYLLFVDDIIVYERVNNDLALLNDNVQNFIKKGDSIYFSITVFNSGINSVSSFDINYQVDTNAAINENINQTINFGEAAQIKFSSPYVASREGLHNVKIWLSNPNNVQDDYMHNDSIYEAFSVWIHGVQNRVLIEHFTQASCNPCAQQNPHLNQLIEKNQWKVSHIAYHPWWPGQDPMYDFNPDQVKTRVRFYGVTGVPTVIINGTNNVGSPTNVTQQLIDQLFQENGLIKVNVWHNRVGDTVKFHIRLIPMTDFPMPVNMYTVWVEDKKYSTPPGTNGETEFPDVMRQMLPDANGYRLDSLRMYDTVFIDLQWVYDNNEINYNKSSVVVFFQDNTTKQVYMTYEKDLTNTTAVDDISDNNTLVVYPNPVVDRLYFRLLDKPGGAKIQIIDNNGKILIQKQTVMSENALDVRGLPQGIYTLRLISGNKTYISKFVKQ